MSLLSGLGSATVSDSRGFSAPANILNLPGYKVVRVQRQSG